MENIHQDSRRWKNWRLSIIRSIMKLPKVDPDKIDRWHSAPNPFVMIFFIASVLFALFALIATQ